MARERRHVDHKAAESVGAPCQTHDLRHTHAAWLIAEGEHPKVIQARLVHSSIQVTIDRYGHVMDGLDHQTATRLDAIAATVRGHTRPKTHQGSPAERAETLALQGFLACSPDGVLFQDIGTTCRAT